MNQGRWLALCGVVAALLIPVAFTAVAGNTPDETASGAEVVSFYRDHLIANRVAALMVTIAAVLLVFFAVRLCEVLRSDDLSAAPFPLAAFGGALITSSGLLLGAVLHFALVQTADQKLAPAAQTLNVLDNNDFFAIVGGLAVLFIAAGIATVRRPVLPRWLGWAAIVIGVLCLGGPIGFAGAVLGLLWILVVAILMLVREDLGAGVGTSA